MDKPNLILLPGLLCDDEVWQHQVKHLADSANIMIPNLSRADTPDKMVAAVLEHAPDTFALAGHSMGGWVALEVMKQAPERVTKLCLANTTAKPDTAEKASARRDMIAQVTRDEHDEVIEHLANAFVYRKELLPQISAMLKRNQAALIPQESAMLARGDCEAILKKIICPTLVIHAEYDKVFNLEDSLQLANSIPNATLATIQEAGHMSLLEQPQTFNELMYKWLAVKSQTAA